MREILFSIGPIKIYGYGAMIALGTFLAFALAMKREKDMDRYDGEYAFDMAFFAMIFGWGAAKILFWITEFPNILADPSFIMDTLSSGFVVYGGLIGGVLTAVIFSKIKKISFLNYFDLIMPCVALAQGFGRIGCLMAGCCYGAETTSAFHIMFTSSGYAPNGVWLIPTQIIMAGADIANCLILSLIHKKSKTEGQTGACFLIFYSIGRFLIEYLRNDPRGHVGPLSTSQFIAIVILLVGVCLYIYTGKRKKTEIA